MIACRICRALKNLHLAIVIIGFSFTVARAQTETPAAANVEAAQPGSEPAPAPDIFCLRTEFFPGGYDETCRPDRLAREIGRQAVLIAARDTLCLATRDESLEEPFPEA